MPDFKPRPVCEKARETVRRVLVEAGLGDRTIKAAFVAAGGPEGGVGNPDLESALRALFEGQAIVPVAVAADAFGFSRLLIYNRLKRLGLSASGRRQGTNLPKERWKAVPGADLTVSDFGRVRGANGWLLKPEVVAGRPRVRARDGRMVTVASAVLAAFKGTDVHRPARHLNGDLMDCHLANLKPDRMRHREEVHGGDHPWTRGEDRLLRNAGTCAEAVRLTGHSIRHVQRRMEELGLTLETNLGRGRRDFADRDLTAVDEAIAHLERAGLSDRDINLGLGVRLLKAQHKPEVQSAIESCVFALHDAGMEPRAVREAMGWSQTTFTKYLNQLGLADTRWPEGWLTAAGPPEIIDGELWKAIPGRKGMVSNLGRVVGARGQLLASTPHHSGGRHVGLVREDDGRIARHKIVALVAAAFRPDIPPLRIAYLNGDPNDVRAENLIPKARKAVATPDRPTAVARSGNVAKAGGEASRLRQHAIWREADAACPAGLDPNMRQDLISEMVLMVMEGRAADARSALKPAMARYNDVMGTYRERSLDAPVGEPDGKTIGDMLSADVDHI